MTYKQIEAIREVRLWIGQIIAPAAIGIVAIESNPELKATIKTKWNEVKKSVKSKFKK